MYNFLEQIRKTKGWKISEENTNHITIFKIEKKFHEINE